MPIHVLPDTVVAQIAAGEVVERPASVVKELMENALDAGATHIHVTAQDGGRTLLRISDNGAGIPADEVELAFARHATSKLRTADDLHRLHTLGFRGEALCSIAAVSQITCITRHHAETHGTKLVIEGGITISKQATGAPSGTIITVENLFYNVPARLKFLKKAATEKRQITQAVTLMAMAYPAVRFVLDQDGREVFRSAGTGQLDDVIVAAYGVEDTRQLVPVNFTQGPIEVRGFTASRELWRTDRSRIHIFVNGRVVQDNNLTYAVTQAYQTVFQAGQYPVAVLDMQIPADDVDVNVHPAKAEVRFREPSVVFAALQRAVREAVIGATGLPEMVASGPRSFGGFPATRGGQQPFSFTSDLPDAASNVARVTLAEDSGAQDDDYAHVPEGIGQPEHPRTLPVLRVIGQVGARYIIAEGPSGVYMIDQHNAHARVLYTGLVQQMANGEAAQTDAIAGAATLPPAQARLVEQAIPLLATLGITLEPFGVNTFRIASAPALLADFDSQTILSALLPDLHADEPQEAVLRGICRLAAVKAGQMLTQEQMQALVRQLERAPEPFTSPDGSPTILHFSSEQLMREFRRS